jgi:HSP20 family protein
LGAGRAVVANGRSTLNEGGNMGLYRIRPWWVSARRTWDPWRDMDEVRQAIEQVATQAAGSDVVPEKGRLAPDVDLYDAGMVLVVRVDLPGMKPADLTVVIEDGALKIEGHRASEGPGEATYLCCERPTGRFVRTLQLPVGVAAEATRATLGDGVLEILLPKAEARSLKAVPVQIEVVGREERLEDVADLRTHAAGMR